MRRGCFAMLATCCAVAAAASTGCGSGGASSSSVAAEPATPTTTRTLSAAEQARADRRRQLALERTFAPNPYREPGDARPHPHGRITRLAVREIKRGRGPAVHGKEVVYVNYVMTFWKSGKKFNEAWGPLRAEYRPLAEDPSGIPRAMIGMRPGGRRVILLPARISQAHEPNGGAGYVDARVDLVLRKIVRSG